LRTDRVSEAEARARKERGRPSARKTRFEEWVKAHTEQDQSTGPTGF
jgi:hypothetical protein